MDAITIKRKHIFFLRIRKVASLKKEKSAKITYVAYVACHIDRIFEKNCSYVQSYPIRVLNLLGNIIL